jgi:hypothetical protein
MSIPESFEFDQSSIDESKNDIDRTKKNWQRSYGYNLQIRYQRNKGALTFEFPVPFTFGEDSLLVWMERERMRRFDPARATGLSITVFYRICTTKFRTNLRFASSQTVADLLHYGEEMINAVCGRGVRNLSFFLAFQSKLFEIGGGSDRSFTVFEMESICGTVELWISIDENHPADCMMVKAMLFEEQGPLQRTREPAFQVKFDYDVEALLNKARVELDSPPLSLFCIWDDGYMEELRGKRPLYEIVQEFPNLRIEHRPQPRSQSFAIVDVDFNYVGVSFQFPLIEGEMIDQLDTRLGEYLEMGRVEVYFRDRGGRPWRPYVPFGEMPGGRFVALVRPAGGGQ